MYGKDSVKCTNVRLVNDHTYYEVVIRWYADPGTQFSVTWYGCHRTQHLNHVDKDYAPVVRAAVKWSHCHLKDGRCYQTTLHIDKYMHVFRGMHSCVLEDRVHDYDPETGLISKVYPRRARELGYQPIRPAAEKPVSRVEQIMAELARRREKNGRETEND